MKIPLISLVIPLYNNELYVANTLRSIMDQSLSDWFCIIVDDGSSDSSFQVAKDMTQNDARFLLVERINYADIKGANCCRNIGLHLARTKRVAFVDADDYLDKECLATRLEVIEADSSYDVYIFKTAFVDEQGGIKGYFYNPNTDIQDIVCRLVQHHIPWHTMSPVWSVDFLKRIGGWNEEYERLQDVELNIRALLAHPKILFTKAPVDSYYRSIGMSSAKKKLARMGFSRLIKDYYFLLMKSNFIDNTYKMEIQRTFEQLLEGQFINYIKSLNERDRQWEELYISTLKALGVEEEEIESVNKIFNKL